MTGYVVWSQTDHQGVQHSYKLRQDETSMYETVLYVQQHGCQWVSIGAAYPSIAFRIDLNVSEARHLAAQLLEKASAISGPEPLAPD